MTAERLVVADASVIVPALADEGVTGDVVRQWLVDLAGGEQLHVLRTFTQLEVLSALRKLVAKGVLAEDHADESLRNYASLPSQRHDLTQPMATRIWELRHNLTAYDAAYVALVERLHADERISTVLATADRKLAAAPGLSIEVRLFED